MTRAPRPYIIEQEAQQAELIDGLRINDDSSAIHLANKLSRCQESREKMRTWGGRPPDLRAVFGKDARYRCEHHACWSCRRAKIRTTAKKDAHRFWDADNEFCSHATIADSTTGDLSEIRQRVAVIVRGLRDRRDAAAEKWALWALVEVVGHVELDPYWATDIQHLAPDQQALIPTLPVLSHADADGVVWVIRIHLAIRHDGISRDDLQEALSRQWPGTGQVHLDPFHEQRSAQDNAGRLLSYSIKHTQQVDIGFTTERWPVQWQVSYWTWLHQMGRAMQPLRVSVGSQRVKPCMSPTSSMPIDHACDEPMPAWAYGDEPMPISLDWSQDLTPMINWGQEKSRFLLEQLVQAAERKRSAEIGQFRLDRT